MERIIYNIPNNAKYFSSVRLVVGSILNTLMLDIEEIEDMKIAVTECLNICLGLCLSPEININFSIDSDKIDIKISNIDSDLLENFDDLRLSLTIIKCLVDETHFNEMSIHIVKNL
ncbi:anti-sigma factor [Peptoniphilus raoultii]|uniref:anti-sigma factor n=1 Tax=Peptoniphilus raoultii TaxID=1776387 RepID=UPI0008DA04B9|nr:anti-sigma factor [Peptoniphilus raoultii]